MNGSIRLSFFVCFFQVIGYDHLNYFRESETYWAPAATTEDLYTQLAENKYREIFRHELR